MADNGPSDWPERGEWLCQRMREWAAAQRERVERELKGGEQG